MDYPMKVYGLNVFELFLVDTLTVLGWATFALALCALFLPRPFALESADRAVFATAGAGVGILLQIAGAGIRQNRAALDFASFLVGALSVAWIVRAAMNRSPLAIATGAMFLLGWIVAIFFRREAVRARFQPRFFSLRQFETMVQVADAMIEPTGPSASNSIATALRVDHLLAQVDAPACEDIRRCLILIEWVLPLLIFRPVPFSDLGSFERRRAVAKVVGARGLFRIVARTLKTLSCVGYYGDPAVMAQVGFVPFEQRARAAGADTSPRRYSDPNA